MLSDPYKTKWVKKFKKFKKELKDDNLLAFYDGALLEKMHNESLLMMF